MEFTAKQIAEFVGGHVEGNEDAKISSFAKIEEGRPGAISFLSNSKYAHYIYTTQSSVCLIDESFTLEQSIPETLTLVRVKSAYEAVSKLLSLYDSFIPKKTGISSLAFVSESAKIGNNCYIAPFVFIGENVVIGDDCRINPHVTIYDGCKVGNRVIIHSGAVIGADGFGFAPTEHGYDKIPQIGVVIIEDDVEIGANTCVDRSTMGATIIHKGAKLDNLIQIAHNVEVGENTVMAAQAGVAGSAKIGQWCMIAGQAGISGHLKIGDKTQLGPQVGIISDVKENSKLIGTPALDSKEFFKSYAVFHNLYDMYKQLNALQREVNELKKK